MSRGTHFIQICNVKKFNLFRKLYHASYNSGIFRMKNENRNSTNTSESSEDGISRKANEAVYSAGAQSQSRTRNRPLPTARTPALGFVTTPCPLTYMVVLPPWSMFMPDVACRKSLSR
jgi:hypothetical protein